MDLFPAADADAVRFYLVNRRSPTSQRRKQTSRQRGKRCLHIGLRLKWQFTSLEFITVAQWKRLNYESSSTLELIPREAHRLIFLPENYRAFAQNCSSASDVANVQCAPHYYYYICLWVCGWNTPTNPLNILATYQNDPIEIREEIELWEEEK